MCVVCFVSLVVACCVLFGLLLRFVGWCLFVVCVVCGSLFVACFVCCEAFAV